MLEDAARLGLNSYRLSLKIGVLPSTVARFVDGETRSVALANKIAEALGQPVSRYVLSAHAARPKLPKKLKAGRYQRTKTKGA